MAETIITSDSEKKDLTIYSKNTTGFKISSDTESEDLPLNMQYMKEHNCNYKEISKAKQDEIKSEPISLMIDSSSSSDESSTYKVDSDTSNSDNEDLDTKEKSNIPKELLQAGDTICYYSTIFVAGDARGYREAKILGINPDEEENDGYPLQLESEELSVGVNSLIKRIKDINNLPIPLPHGKWKKLSLFHMIRGKCSGLTKSQRLTIEMKKFQRDLDKDLIQMRANRRKSQGITNSLKLTDKDNTLEDELFEPQSQIANANLSRKTMREKEKLRSSKQPRGNILSYFKRIDPSTNDIDTTIKSPRKTSILSQKTCLTAQTSSTKTLKDKETKMISLVNPDINSKTMDIKSLNVQSESRKSLSSSQYLPSKNFSRNYNSSSSSHKNLNKSFSSAALSKTSSNKNESISEKYWRKHNVFQDQDSYRLETQMKEKRSIGNLSKESPKRIQKPGHSLASPLDQSNHYVQQHYMQQLHNGFTIPKKKRTVE